MSKLLFLSIVSVLLGIVCADYCSINCQGRPHIGCNNDGSWAASCPSDKQLRHISTADRQTILNAHNNHRNFVAGGNVGHLNAACRMATMQWDNELARLAALNVKTCEFKHDRCRSTKKFPSAGQSIAWMGYFDPLNQTAELIKGVDMWYSEVAVTKQSHIDKYPSNYQGPAIGHFTVMVDEDNTHVGCAVSTYSVEGEAYKAYLMTCNYAGNNMLEQRIYESCSVPAQKCTTGTGPFENLCSVNEKY